MVSLGDLGWCNSSSIMQNVKGTYLATEYRKGLQLITVSMSFPVQKKNETTMSCDAFRAPFHCIDTTIPAGHMFSTSFSV